MANEKKEDLNEKVTQSNPNSDVGSYEIKKVLADGSSRVTRRKKTEKDMILADRLTRMSDAGFAKLDKRLREDAAQDEADKVYDLIHPGAKELPRSKEHGGGKGRSEKEYGALTSEVVKLAKRHRCQEGESVPKKTRNKILKALADHGFGINDNTLRSLLSKNGYSAERKGLNS